MKNGAGKVVDAGPAMPQELPVVTPVRRSKRKKKKEKAAVGSKAIDVPRKYILHVQVEQVILGRCW